MPADGCEWGGAVVVLGAGESPAQGEGPQRAKQEEECNARRSAGEYRRRAVAGS